MHIIAHRGASGEAPENTLSAFRLAWAQGADGIEMDVHLSADGRVMVHHDDDTERLCGEKLIIAETGSARLQTLDVGRWKGEAWRGEAMPYLEDVLAEVPAGKQAYIEIKSGEAIVPALAKALTVLDPNARPVIISFNADALVGCREALPGVPLYWVLDAEPGPSLPTAVIQTAVDLGFTGLDPDHVGVTAGWVSAARQAGLHLACWTVNRPEDMRRMASLGLDAITTDVPAVARTTLGGDVRA